MGPFSPFRWFRSPQAQARCRTALSEQTSLDAAVKDVSFQLGNAVADLGMVFISSHFASDLPRLLPLLQTTLKANHWLGCIGGGVVGTGSDGQSHELEQTPALSVSLLNLPGAVLQPFSVSTDKLPDLDGSNQTWHQWLGVDPSQLRSLLVVSTTPSPAHPA